MMMVSRMMKNTSETMVMTSGIASSALLLRMATATHGVI